MVFFLVEPIYKCILRWSLVCDSFARWANRTTFLSLSLPSPRSPLRGADIDHRIISFFARRTTADSPSGCYSLYLMKNQNSISKSTVPMPSVATKPQSSTPNKPAEPLSNSSEQEPKSTTDQVERTHDRCNQRLCCTADLFSMDRLSELVCCRKPRNKRSSSMSSIFQLTSVVVWLVDKVFMWTTFVKWVRSI